MMGGSHRKKLITTQIPRIVMITLLLACSFTAQDALAKRTPVIGEQQAPPIIAQVSAPPPLRADQETSEKGFSTWDIQGLYGSKFHEPGTTKDVMKGTATLENSSGWSWGSSYFFFDYLRSNSADQNATEFYGEWYPSASISKMSKKAISFGPLRDVLLTMGFNAGTKSTGAAPLVFLPGLTFDLKIPGFQFFSLGVYMYIDRGRISGVSNGSNTSTYQITPSWSLPFNIGAARFRFDGFIDYIGRHGNSAHQIISQPTIKLDLGNFAGKPDKLLVGAEWALWRNKYGISGFNQTAPQAVIMWVL
jgi:nucleoside-specific outer membrane channel protein Tsx